MKTSERGKLELMGHEGVVTAPYRDSVGRWTFGVGHTAAAGMPDPQAMPDKPFPVSYALQVLEDDLLKYEKAVNEAFTRPLSQEQFDAAVSFHFNTGGIKRAYWVRLWNAGKDAEARKAFLNWNKPPEILSRRKMEQKLFFEGKYSHETIPVYSAKNGNVLWDKVTSLPLSALRTNASSPLSADGGTPKPSPEQAPARSFWSKLCGALKGRSNG